MIVPLLLLALAVVPLVPLYAQQHPAAHGRPTPGDSMARGDTMPQMQQDPMMAMMMGPLGISMAREGSGTSWLPDSTPMYMVHAAAGSWLLMLHGNAFLQYIDEGGDRGDDQFGSINWVMGMARRSLAGGHLRLRAMLSAEPATVGACGYPDLLATGEFCNGEPIHDRQHPHDLFMELSAGYERALTHDLAFELYAAPVGEPALGPVAYPHRVSALPNPIAPIGHHWLDATHISFGVATVGVFGRRWKLEGSLFNGREPDEERYDLDLDRLDSYAGRFWLLPSDRWALQVSAGRLVEAEQHEPGEPREDVTRTTASATYHRPLGAGGVWATTAAWGRNTEEEQATDAFLVETNLDLDQQNVFFGRAEAARKSAADLALDEPALSGDVFTVAKAAVGYTRQFGPFGSFVPGLGAAVDISLVPRDLERFYGTRTPLGFAVFVSLRPRAMSMPGMMHSMPGGMPPMARHGAGRE